jgi:hypothetical protein
MLQEVHFCSAEVMMMSTNDRGGLSRRAHRRQQICGRGKFGEAKTKFEIVKRVHTSVRFPYETVLTLVMEMRSDKILHRERVSRN